MFAPPNGHIRGSPTKKACNIFSKSVGDAESFNAGRALIT